MLIYSNGFCVIRDIALFDDSFRSKYLEIGFCKIYNLELDKKIDDSVYFRPELENIFEVHPGFLFNIFIGGLGI